MLVLVRKVSNIEKATPVWVFKSVLFTFVMSLFSFYVKWKVSCHSWWPFRGQRSGWWQSPLYSSKCDLSDCHSSFCMLHFNHLLNCLPWVRERVCACIILFIAFWRCLRENLSKPLSSSHRGNPLSFLLALPSQFHLRQIEQRTSPF